MKFQLMHIEEDIYKKVGELILLFSHVEWLMANALLLGSHKDTAEYEKAKDLSVTQKYFETLVSLNFSRKAEALREVGFDTTVLRKIGEYRNMISHGLIFEGKNLKSLIIQRATKLDSPPAELNINKLTSEIELLSEEAGKIIKYIQDKGYTIPGLK